MKKIALLAFVFCLLVWIGVTMLLEKRDQDAKSYVMIKFSIADLSSGKRTQLKRTFDSVDGVKAITFEDGRAQFLFDPADITHQKIMTIIRENGFSIPKGPEKKLQVLDYNIHYNPK